MSKIAPVKAAPVKTTLIPIRTSISRLHRRRPNFRALHEIDDINPDSLSLDSFIRINPIEANEESNCKEEKNTFESLFEGLVKSKKFNTVLNVARVFTVLSFLKQVITFVFFRKTCFT